MYLAIRASRKISWKHLFLGFFLVICQTGWRTLLFLDCFFTFIWPLKVIKTLFIYFNHQIKSITSLNCNMTSIQFVFSRGDSALCYIGQLVGDSHHLVHYQVSTILQLLKVEPSDPLLLADVPSLCGMYPAPHTCLTYKMLLLPVKLSLTPW